MAPHSSPLAWKIPWVEEPGRLQSMGSRRVGHDWVTSRSLFTFMHWRRKWQPTQCSCLENPRDGGAWWAAVSGVAQSRTQLKWLSNSSSYANRASQIVQWYRICLPMQEIQEMQFQSLGWDNPLKRKKATHSSMLASKIPWTEEPGRL